MTVPLCTECRDVSCITAAVDGVFLCNAHYINRLRAQLAESAAREVQLRAELTNTRASIQSLIVEAKTLRGISSHAVITFGGVMIGDIDRGLAAPPSTAAAELQQRTEVADAAVSLSEHADRLHASCDCIDIPRFDCCTCGAYEASEALAWLNRQVDALAVVTKAREVKP